MEEIRLKPYKKDFAFSYTQGVFPTLELIGNRPQAIIRILLSEKGRTNAGVEKIIKFSEESGIPALFDDRGIQRSGAKENCFALGVFRKYTDELDFAADHLVLVNPSDMGNLGTIIRTAAAFGVFNLAIITPSADIFDPKVIRASMGALFHINVQLFGSFAQYQESAANRRYLPFMLDGRPISELHFTGKEERSPFSLIFGNESSGLPDSFLEVGSPVRIVHLDTVDSLNLPTAVGIGLYHFTKYNR